MAAALFLAVAVWAARAPLGAGPAPSREVTKLITALAHADRAAFVSDGDSAFAAFDQDQFELIALRFGPRLRDGYRISPLGRLNQSGHLVTLWKISFDGNRDDVLATLGMRAGKVTWFWLS